jgi:phosphohistidine phosphatase
MKRLILMRHAKTEPWAEGVDDHARALTPSGHKAAAAMGATLADEGWVPEKVLVSTARRTRETWALLSLAFPDAKPMIEDDLYLAGERGISDLISDNDGVETLMVLGHNPGLHDLGLTQIREAGSKDHQAAMRLAAKLPTGAAALFEADEHGAYLPIHFKLVNFIRPKDVLPEG